jgi:uncharacterized protein YkwD
MLLLLPGTAAAADQGCADDTTGVTDLTASWEAQLLDLTNQHRSSKGLVALQLDTTLTRASVWKARDMARRNYFSHDDPANGGAPARDPWDRLEACGWNTGGSRAENIAAGYSTPADVVQGWLDSPGHRANIENGALRYVGFGVASSESSSYGRYQVQMFASVPGPATTTPISQPPADGGDDDQVRDPLGGGGSASTAVADPVARITRTRCSGRLAVAGWCYRLVVRGRVSSSEAGARTVAIARRAANRRVIQLGALRSASSGSFTRTFTLRPPSRGTSAWLQRNATAIRITVAATTTARAATRWTTARTPR